MKKSVYLSLAGAAIAALLSADPAAAVTKCKLKIDKRTGVLRVDAAGVGGPLRWGTASGDAGFSFFNDPACIRGNAAKRCELADPSTLAAKMLPGQCMLFVDDGVAECSIWVRGCSPGVRESAGFLWKDADGDTIGVSDVAGSFAVHHTGSTYVILGIAAGGDGFQPSGNTYYESGDCTGQAYLDLDPGTVKTGRPRGPNGPALYSLGLGAIEITYLSRSYTSFQFIDQTNCSDIYPGSTFNAPNSCCLPANSLGNFEPASTLNLSGFATPFVFTPQ